MYGFKTTLTEITFENAIRRVAEEQKKEGFGILSDIEVKTTLKAKLDNVVVREEEDDSITVAFMDPAAVLNLVDREEVVAIGMEVHGRLEQVRDSLRDLSNDVAGG